MLVVFLADRWSYTVRMLTMFAVFALESRRTNTLSHKLVTYSPIVTDWTVLGTCTTPDQGLTLCRKKTMIIIGKVGDVFSRGVFVFQFRGKLCLFKLMMLFSLTILVIKLIVFVRKCSCVYHKSRYY